MMEVSVVYEVADIVCDSCLNYHVAVIETNMIKIVIKLAMIVLYFCCFCFVSLIRVAK